MTRAKKQIEGDKKPRRSAELKLVELALHRLSEVEPGSAYACTADAQVRVRVHTCKRELQKFFLPLLPDLERILARELPEARITSPCGECPARDVIRSPVQNFLICFDLCGVCLEEANRALRLARNRILEKTAGEFLSPATISARINAAQAREARQDAQRRVAREQGPILTFHENGDGTVSVSRTQPRITSVSRSHLPGLPPALAPFADHLIEWGDLANYLMSSGVRDVPGTVRSLKSAAPSPVFMKKSHRSLYRLSDGFLAATGPAHVPAHLGFRLTRALKLALLPPGHIPKWAPAPKSSVQ